MSNNKQDGPSFTTWSRPNQENKWETFRINRMAKFFVEVYEVNDPLTQQPNGRRHSFTITAESADDAYERSKKVIDNMFERASNAQDAHVLPEEEHHGHFTSLDQ